MKFYGKDGEVYNSRFKAMTSRITKNVNKFIDDKFPGANAIFQTNRDIIDADFYEEISDEFDDEEEESELQKDKLPSTLNEEISASKDVKKHIEIDYARCKLYLKDDDGNMYAESDLDPKLTKGIIDSDVFKMLYPDGNIPPDIEIINISTPLEKDIQQRLNDYGITDISAKQLLSSSDQVSLLKTHGASEESINNLTGNK